MEGPLGDAQHHAALPVPAGCPPTGSRAQALAEDYARYSFQSLALPLADVLLLCDALHLD